MKFTDGFWQLRPGVTPLYAQEAYDIWPEGENGIVVTAPTMVIEKRGDVLNRPVLTVRLSSPLPNIIGVKVSHFTGGRDELGFDLVGAEEGHGVVSITDEKGVLTSGALSVTVQKGAPYGFAFEAAGRVVALENGNVGKAESHFLLIVMQEDSQGPDTSALIPRA